MKLVPDWKKAWKWHSTQLMAAAAALPFAWSQLPSDLRAWVPEDWLPWIAAIMLVAGMIGRLRNQNV